MSQQIQKKEAASHRRGDEGYDQGSDESNDNAAQFIQLEAFTEKYFTKKCSLAFKELSIITQNAIWLPCLPSHVSLPCNLAIIQGSSTLSDLL
jgi:hypothetical protein